MAKALAVAYHNLSVMLEAGVPIQRSLSSVVQGLKGPVRAAFSDLERCVAAGKCLSEIMAGYPRVFAALDVMVVEAADESGNLAESLKLLPQWYEFCGRLRALVVSRLLLPFALINITALIGPLPSLLLGRTNLGQFIFESLQIASLFYVPAVVIVAVIRLSPDTGSCRHLLDHLTLKIPLLGKAVRQLALSRYCRAFSMLCKAGIPAERCAEKAAAVTGNSVVRGLLRNAVGSASSGHPLYEGFSRELPPEFLNLWEIAEQSGQLDGTTERLAKKTGEAAEFMFTEFAVWLPRLVYAFVCIVIIAQIFKNAALIGYP